MLQVEQPPQLPEPRAAGLSEDGLEAAAQRFLPCYGFPCSSVSDLLLSVLHL